jgi:hypothetical protein
MAKLVLQGDTATVLLSTDPEEGTIIATCESESCVWSERYDDLNDASEYASDHADFGGGGHIA